MKYASLMLSVFLCMTSFAAVAFAQNENAAAIPSQDEYIDAVGTQTDDANAYVETVHNEDVQPAENSGYAQPAENSGYAQPAENSGYAQPAENSGISSDDGAYADAAGFEPVSYWNPGFSIAAKIGPELSTAGILTFWVGYGGISGGLEIGYHWNIFGLYLSQQFSGTWDFNERDSFDSADDEKNYKRDNNAFKSVMGMTAIDVRWFLSNFERIRFSLGCGVGLEYALNYKPVDEDDDSRFLVPLIRFHFGVNYLMTPNLSLGFRLDYSGFSLWIVHYHQIEPAFTVSYTF